jgi:pimeloyl-ACP methyl ester carboxylesterase
VQQTEISSTLDGTRQSIRFIEGAVGAPLLVFLHPWSGNFTMDEPECNRLAQERQWTLIQPDFRGPNVRPEACGSELAQQDILDAVAWARTSLTWHPRRIFLAGVSGGGHMAMLMSARYPIIWDAVSEWVGISDLRAWYTEHLRDGEPQRYARDIEACLGGRPGSESFGLQCPLRSPLGQLMAARDLAIDFNAGVNDGHSGSVPIHHTIDAFNEVALANGAETVSQEEIRELTERRSLKQARESNRVDDPDYGRKIHLRRHAGRSRLTIFEGGHEGLPTAAFGWFDRHL